MTGWHEDFEDCPSIEEQDQQIAYEYYQMCIEEQSDGLSERIKEGDQPADRCCHDGRQSPVDDSDLPF